MNPKRFFIQGYFYHVFTKSIAGYEIFKSENDYKRMIEMMEFYSYKNFPIKFSIYHKADKNQKKQFLKALSLSEKLVTILAYCIMPTHIHFLLTPEKENGISIFMRNLLNSYTRYFNIKNKRKGPLWQGRFKYVLIDSEEQLLHLTRYIHLNPTSSDLVANPDEWEYSSYKEYLKKTNKSICNFSKFLNIIPEDYKNFVEEHIDYQKELHTSQVDTSEVE